MARLCSLCARRHGRPHRAGSFHCVWPCRWCGLSRRSADEVSVAGRLSFAPALVRWPPFECDGQSCLGAFAWWWLAVMSRWWMFVVVRSLQRRRLTAPCATTQPPATGLGCVFWRAAGIVGGFCAGGSKQCGKGGVFGACVSCNIASPGTRQSVVCSGGRRAGLDSGPRPLHRRINACVAGQALGGLSRVTARGGGWPPRWQAVSAFWRVPHGTSKVSSGVGNRATGSLLC